MRSKPVALLLADLSVTKTHSRPYTSTDNPYSEAQFKTLKHFPSFPRRFVNIASARSFCEGFFGYYNHDHRHSGIALHTPADVHFGRADAVRERRQEVLDAAYLANPGRFRSPPRAAPRLPAEAWINRPEDLMQGTGSKTVLSEARGGPEPPEDVSRVPAIQASGL